MTACLVENPVIAAPVLLLLEETVDELDDAPAVVIPAGSSVLFANPAVDHTDKKKKGSDFCQFLLWGSDVVLCNM